MAFLFLFFYLLSGYMGKKRKLPWWASSTDPADWVLTPAEKKRAKKEGWLADD